MATVAWEGSLIDGSVITNSAEETGGMPKSFVVGTHEVFKCWDLAMTQLRSGDKVKLTCPAELAYGGAKLNSPLSGEAIPPNSDVIFDFTVTSCNQPFNFGPLAAQPKTTVMQPDRCMYLKLAVSDDIGYDIVLSSEE